VVNRVTTTVPTYTFQPSGSLMPTATCSDLSEPAVSSERATRHMFSDMSGSLSDKPDGTKAHTQVTNTCLLAGERPNKTSVFITGTSDTRAFLAWFAGVLSSWPVGPTKRREFGSRPINRQRVQSLGQRTVDPRWEGGCEFPHFLGPGGQLCAATGEETV
jgi:hypothetical protein